MSISKRALAWIIFLAVYFVNVDIVIAPALYFKTGLGFWNRYFVAEACSFFGCCYCWWFFGRRSVLKQKIGLVKDKLVATARKTGFFVQAANIVLTYMPWVKWLATHKKKTMSIIQRGGIVGTFLVGVTPDLLLGARGGTILVCRSCNWRKGFIVFLAGDVIKNFIVAVGIAKLM